MLRTVKPPEKEEMRALEPHAASKLQEGGKCASRPGTFGRKQGNHRTQQGMPGTLWKVQQPMISGEVGTDCVTDHICVRGDLM